MLIFNVTIHKFWGRVLAKFQEARAIEYADDGYIKGKLSVSVSDVVHIIISVITTFGSVGFVSSEIPGNN